DGGRAETTLQAEPGGGEFPALRSGADQSPARRAVAGAHWLAAPRSYRTRRGYVLDVPGVTVSTARRVGLETVSKRSAGGSENPRARGGRLGDGGVVPVAVLLRDQPPLHAGFFSRVHDPGVSGRGGPGASRNGVATMAEARLGRLRSFGSGAHSPGLLSARQVGATRFEHDENVYRLESCGAPDPARAPTRFARSDLPQRTRTTRHESRPLRARDPTLRERAEAAAAQPGDRSQPEDGARVPRGAERAGAEIKTRSKAGQGPAAAPGRPTKPLPLDAQGELDNARRVDLPAQVLQASPSVGGHVHGMVQGIEEVRGQA